MAVLAASAALAQGTDPKAKPSDYPGSTKAGFITMAAENWGHGMTSPGGTILLNDYVAIEVALYAEKNRRFTVEVGKFSLYVNGAKKPLLPASPGMVAASVKYPDWERRAHMEGDGSVGNAQVGLGRPTRVERFPGDPNARRRPIPRAPDPADRSGADKPPPLSIDEVAQRNSLPEGEVRPPVSGFLFFPLKEKLKKIKTLELHYEGPDGTAVLGVP